MNPITLEQYLGQYADHPDATPERRANAVAMLAKVNAVRALAHEDGVEMPDNPKTGCGVGGSGNGGFRPQSSSVGAPNTKHKDGHAVDPYDPKREFARWCLRNLHELRKRGLHMENPMWTPTWCHLQDVPPKSGKQVYVPNENPPLAEALPEQEQSYATA